MSLPRSPLLFARRLLLGLCLLPWAAAAHGQEVQVQSVTTADGSGALSVPVGAALTLTLRGQNLHLIEGATVLLGRVTASGVVAELAPVNPRDRTRSTVRQVTITAAPGARLADGYRLRLVAGRGATDAATFAVTPAPSRRAAPRPAPARQPPPTPQVERAAPVERPTTAEPAVPTPPQERVAPPPARPADIPARPAVQTAIEPDRVVVFRGQSGTLELDGVAAGRMDAVRVVDAEGRPVVGVQASLGAARGAERTILIAAAKDAALGAFQLEGRAGRRPIDLGRRIYVVETAAAAEAEIRSRNAAEQAQRTVFSRRGWTPVAAEAPDPRVLALDPSAPKEALLHHLRTVALGGEAVGRLERLAAETTDADVRSGAIRALGASPDPEARAALVDLFAETRSTSVRVEILENLGPRSAEEPAAQLLLQAGTDRTIPERTRTAAVSRVAAAGLAARPRVEPAPMLGGTSPSLQKEIQDKQTLLYRGGSALGGAVEQRDRFHIELASRGTVPSLDPTFSANFERWRQGNAQKSWWALKAVRDGDPVPATPAELADPGRYRQILFLPAGYTEAERDRFDGDVANFVTRLGDLDQDVWTAKYRDRIVYIAQWLPGDPLPAVDGQSRANFDARLYTHPTRDGLGITSSNRKVIEAVDSFRSNLPNFAPIAVAVVFNAEQPATANAILPTLMIPQFASANAAVRGYGIARIRRTEGSLTTMHELAHAGLNFLDEYHEDYLADVSIDVLDGLNSLVLFDGSWGGFGNALESLIGHYAFRVSRVLVDMGADNISTRRFPSLVGGTGAEYETEGGMFFGRGVWHQAPSIMGTSAQGNPGSQQRILRQVFEGAPPGRANDRIQAAGPIREWLPQFGGQVRALLHDADKHHRWHPTTRYEVQLGYWEKVWTSCPVVVGGSPVNDIFGNPVTYPCTEDVWRSSVRQVTPLLRTVDLSQTLLSGMAGAVLAIFTHYGLDSFELGDGQSFTFPPSVDELGESALPTILWAVPYQEVEIDAPNRLTTYHWRFRTHNGSSWSGWTGWAKFSRAT